MMRANCVIEKWGTTKNKTSKIVGSVRGVEEKAGGLDYYTERNNFQLPAYHRLDLGINIYRPKKKNRMGIWNISIYNVYSYMAPVSIRKGWWYNNDCFYTLGIVPIIPSVSYTYKF